MKTKEYKDRNRQRRSSTPSVDISTLVYGKVPPQAIDMERSVLGAIMLERGALAEVSDILRVESFYTNAHQVIFQAAKNLDLKGKPVDVLTIVEELKVMGMLEEVGGAYFVTMLTNDVVSAANILEHARVVVEKFMKRESIRIGGQMVADGYEDSTDPFDLLDEAEKNLSAISNGNHRGKYSSLDSALVKTLHRIEHLRTLKTKITGVPSGFQALDHVTAGWQNTDLIILAARPAVGKTALALNLARNAAKAGTPVAFFSLEMSEGQLTQRILSAESDIWLEKIARGQMEDHEMTILYAKGIQSLSNMPIFIDDTPALNIFELRAKCRRMKSKHGIGLIIIDYLQLMSGLNERGQNREQEIATISRNLKQLAKELDVPIIALSQLSRAVENRTGEKKMPQLSDLRESGAIEQDADMVMFMYRPEYYEVNANEQGESTRGETHLKIAKHRNGALETIKLRALLHIQKFIDWDGGDLAGTLPLPTGTWRPVPTPYADKDDLI